MGASMVLVYVSVACRTVADVPSFCGEVCSYAVDVLMLRSMDSTNELHPSACTYVKQKISELDLMRKASAKRCVYLMLMMIDISVTCWYSGWHSLLDITLDAGLCKARPLLCLVQIRKWKKIVCS